MITIEIILFLKRISIFSSLTSYELRKIAEVLSEDEFQAGETLFAEGDFGDCMYFVTEGKFSVYTGKTPAIKILAVFEKGQFFGEMGLYDDKPRAASAMAQTNAKVLTLRKGEFCDLISEFPMVALGIMKELNTRIRATNQKLNLIEKNVIESTSKLYARDYFVDCVSNYLSKAAIEEQKIGFLKIRLRKLEFKKDKKSLETETPEILRSNLIKELGMSINDFIRESDMVCRYSEDSILLMIPDLDHKGLLKFQARITDDLNQILVEYESEKSVSSDIEFKIFVFPEDAKTPQKLFEMIDVSE